MRRNFLSFFKLTLLVCLTVGITIYLLKSLDLITNVDRHWERLHSIRASYLRKGSFFDSPRNVRHEKMDWHDYTFIEEEVKREGQGEQGKAAYLSKEDDDQLQDKLFKRNGFNALLSDKISVNRSISDIRHKG